MKTVDVSECSKIRMAAGNEKRFTRVIDENILKEWVAIGWVDVRKATKEDKKKYPTVVRNET